MAPLHATFVAGVSLRQSEQLLGCVLNPKRQKLSPLYSFSENYCKGEVQFLCFTGGFLTSIGVKNVWRAPPRVKLQQTFSTLESLSAQPHGRLQTFAQPSHRESNAETRAPHTHTFKENAHTQNNDRNLTLFSSCSQTRTGRSHRATPLRESP